MCLLSLCAAFKLGTKYLLPDQMSTILTNYVCTLHLSFYIYKLPKGQCLKHFKKIVKQSQHSVDLTTSA